MKQHNDHYQVIPFPKMRRLEGVMFRSVRRRPMMHGLLEVDVTRARAYLRAHKANTGEALSFTAFIITCLAKAVDEHKAVQAIRLGRKHLIFFEDVDVLTYIERDVAGQKHIRPCIIRAANRKTFRQIHHEIRAAQVEPVAQSVEAFKAFQFLPTLLFRFLLWILGSSPQLGKKYRGTVGLSSVGMFGKGSSWGIPPAAPTLTITVGGIGEKPGIARGHIANREYLSLTISFDHDLIDGAPAARFAGRLKDLIESGYGLCESEAEHIDSLAEEAGRSAEQEAQEERCPC